jgi:hypothetical protein
MVTLFREVTLLGLLGQIDSGRHMKWRHSPQGIIAIVTTKRDLPEIIGTLDLGRLLSNLLDSAEAEQQKHAQDGCHHKHVNQPDITGAFGKRWPQGGTPERFNERVAIRRSLLPSLA